MSSHAELSRLGTGTKEIGTQEMIQILFLGVLAPAFQQPELGEELLRKRNRKSHILFLFHVRP